MLYQSEKKQVPKTLRQVCFLEHTQCLNSSTEAFCAKAKTAEWETTTETLKELLKHKQLFRGHNFACIFSKLPRP